jgi:hypothetical protein
LSAATDGLAAKGRQSEPGWRALPAGFALPTTHSEFGVTS